MAEAIARENRDMDSLFQVVTLVLALDHSEGGEIFAWSRAIVEKWPLESEYRKRADQIVIRNWQRRLGVEFETDIKTTDRQIHENLLTAFGVDPTAEPWAGEHTFVSAGPRDPILDRLGLQSAGPKVLHCTLHKYAVTGADFEGIDETFRRDHCDSCADRMPRPPEWRFTDGWQDGENYRWAEYLNEFRSR